MNRTGIDYLDWTWNPLTGCSPISTGCKHCWARAMTRRLAGRAGYPRVDPFQSVFREGRLKEPRKVNNPGRIGVCFMGDLAFCEHPRRAARMVLEEVARAPWHRFLILTKRPEQLWSLLDETCVVNVWSAPSMFGHAWFGITAENQELLEKRWPALVGLPNGVHRWISLEPLLGPVDLLKVLQGPIAPEWVVVGCESGPGRRPTQGEWIGDVIKDCRALEIPVFVKQAEIHGRVSHEPADWPVWLRWREFPEGLRLREIQMKGNGYE